MITDSIAMPDMAEFKELDEERSKLDRQVKQKNNRICALPKKQTNMEKQTAGLKGYITRLKKQIQELEQSARTMTTKKAWLKMIAEIDDPYFCESLINQLEAQKRKLSKGEFESETPRG